MMIRLCHLTIAGLLALAACKAAMQAWQTGGKTQASGGGEFTLR